VKEEDIEFVPQEEEDKIKRLQKMSNVEFMKDIMDFHPSGGLAQLLVIEALRFYCELQADQDLIQLQILDKEKPTMVLREAWYECAKDIQRLMDIKYGHDEIRKKQKAAKKEPSRIFVP